MYSKLVSFLKVRDTEFLPTILYDLSIYSEKIILVTDLDIDKNLVKEFDLDISTEINPTIYNPDWVMILEENHIPDWRFQFMKDSLCLNEYVNIWESKVVNLWDEENYYRTDKFWDKIIVPFLYRWIPEVDLENQPGPQENCGIYLKNYGTLNTNKRLSFYPKTKMSHIEKIHYDSLFDKKVQLERLYE